MKPTLVALGACALTFLAVLGVVRWAREPYHGGEYRSIYRLSRW